MDGRIIETLLFRGYQVRLFSFSALDKYIGLPSLPHVFAETNAGIADLAHYSDELRFPGADLADAAVDCGGSRFYFRCVDSCEAALDISRYAPCPAAPNPSFTMLSLVYDLRSRRFIDINGVYPEIRSLKKTRFQKEQGAQCDAGWWEKLDSGAGCVQALTDCSLLLARYESIDLPPDDFTEALAAGIENESSPGTEKQQALLTGLMCSSRPDRGLELLKASGFLKKFWPEIARLDSADHSKEFHPEGNAWKHTLNTFEHRKHFASGEFDLRLSLALLLHDIGKPMAEGFGGRRFDGHAEIGAKAAKRFLERLDFDSTLADDVYYLVKNHMLPAALARLSLTKTEGVMNSPLFPSLMELYRCDESSSFKGLDGFYVNSAAYQAYLRNMKNPYRTPAGKITRSRRRH